MNFSSISIIALQTLRSSIRDRIFYSALIFSLLFVLFSYFLSTLTILESRKLLLDFGLAAISLSGIAISLFLGITLIGKEMEKRTIYSILSKPILRSEYLLGKIIGGGFILILLHLLNFFTLSCVLWLLGESYPEGYLACIYLMILESLIVLVFSMFLSLYTSSLMLGASLSISFFLIGRSSLGLKAIADKAQSSVGKTIIKIFYDIFPNLSRFDIREVVAYSKPYPDGFVQLGTLYFLFYFIFLIILCNFIFRKKDLT